ncbi:hypothetical protein ACLB2K_038389 [Fragaria x ananassa]
MEMAQVQSSPTVQRHHLVIDSLDNIVAEGTIVEVGVDSSSQTVHGVPLAAENIRVSVSKCLVENALLPVPIRDEIVFVSDAIGTCVAWPKDWVIPATAVGNAKQAPRKYGRKKTKQWVDTDKDDDDLEHLPADLPPALLSLSKWGNEFLKDRATIHTKLSKDLFGTERKIALFRSDLFAFTNVQEVAGDTIVMYMSFLREKLKESNMLNMIGFVDPSSLGVGNSTDRSRSFSAALKRGKPGQFFLVPYNTGKHWILSVVSPSEELVYFMDPMKRRMDVTTDEWRTIVNQYGIPEQIGDKSCGYFIMLYMREIVQDKEQNWTKKWLTRGDEKYTMQDVDVVRQEWAEFNCETLASSLLPSNYLIFSLSRSPPSRSPPSSLLPPSRSPPSSLSHSWPVSSLPLPSPPPPSSLLPPSRSPPPPSSLPPSLSRSPPPPPPSSLALPQPPNDVSGPDDSQTYKPSGDGAGGAPFIEAGGRPSFLEAAVASDPGRDAAASSVPSADATGLTCSRWLKDADLSTAPASGSISGVPVRAFLYASYFCEGIIIGDRDEIRRELLRHKEEERPLFWPKVLSWSREEIVLPKVTKGVQGVPPRWRGKRTVRVLTSNQVRESSGATTRARNYEQ